MKFKKEFIIGLTTILVCVSAYFGIRFFQGNNPFVNAKNHYAIYPEINNLQVGNSVLISGLKVGQVTNTALIEDARVRVDFSIENSYPIPVNTIAEIIENGLMGGMAINLNLGNSSEIAEHDMPFSGELQDGLFTKVGKQLEPLSEQSGAFMVKFDSLLAVYTRLGEHLDQKIENLELQQTLTSFQTLANNLQETSLVAKQAMSAMNSKVDSLNINQ
ncbi:MAG: MlaD family protein, partial [Flavobacteriales bacterium]